ncbi:M15 family metallopeptidase [uncultured Roseibium sp.]|uniref:M15 family metallopeptidase n=1 Tax=uncultured Roseibium sp. TaxID=1936171 RepID=UPI0026029070|nr:M15 family metallopeptidase [uncultured Roseibium sp.]
MHEDEKANAEVRQKELALLQRAADEAERQSRFERRLKLVELKERREDRKLRRLEIENSAGKGIRFTSGQATVAAAALAVLSAIVGGLIQSSSTRDVEANRSDAQLAIETLRANATIDLEEQKQEAAERLEKAEFETTLILKAIEAPAREDQIKNLKFFLNAGFISDTDGKIAAIEENDFPSLPRQSDIGRLPVPDRNADLSVIFPALRMKVSAILATLEAEGIPLRVFEAYRHPLRQFSLYARGRTAPGNRVTNAGPWESLQNFGFEVDFAIYKNDTWSWSSTGENERYWNRLSELADEHGLVVPKFNRTSVQLNVALTDLQNGVYPSGGDAAWTDNLVSMINAWPLDDKPAAPN